MSQTFLSAALSGLEVRPDVNTRIPQDDHWPHLNNLGQYAHGLRKNVTFALYAFEPHDDAQQQVPQEETLLLTQPLWRQVPPLVEDQAARRWRRRSRLVWCRLVWHQSTAPAPPPGRLIFHQWWHLSSTYHEARTRCGVRAPWSCWMGRTRKKILLKLCSRCHPVDLSTLTYTFWKFGAKIYVPTNFSQLFSGTN